MNSTSSVYLISYDLCQPGQNYESVAKRIQRFPAWFHILQSAWFVQTSANANYIYEQVRQCLDQNDLLFVTRVDPIDRMGWLSKDAVAWLTNHTSS